MKLSLARVLTLAAILMLASGVTTVLYYNYLNGDRSLSWASFEGKFSHIVQDFNDFVGLQAHVTRQLADTLEAIGAMPSALQLSKVARMYDGLFPSQLVGIAAVVKRIANADAAKTDFSNFLHSRHATAFQISLYSEEHADAGDADVWIVQDVIQGAAGSVHWQPGLQLSSSPILRSAMYDTLTSDVPVAFGARSSPQSDSVISTSSLFHPTLAASKVSMLWLTPVSLEGINSSYLVITALQVDEYIDEIVQLSPGVAAVFTDSTEKQYANGDCSMSSVLPSHVLKGSFPLSKRASDSVTVTIGACPSYSDQFVTWKRSLVLSLCVLTTALLISSCVMIWQLQDKKVGEAVDKVLSEARVAAQKLVIGYVCHELRNPLHVVKSAFKTLITCLGSQCACADGQGARRLPIRSYSGGSASGSTGSVVPPSTATTGSSSLNVSVSRYGGDLGDAEEGNERITDEELLSIIDDAHSAIAQMQVTLNDVLDYRSLEAGVGALKLNRKLTTVSKVVKSVLMRSRALMPVGVNIHWVCPTPDATIAVDRVRVGQILTNGLSNAGKFANGKDILVRIQVVKDSETAPQPMMGQSQPGVKHTSMRKSFAKLERIVPILAGDSNQHPHTGNTAPNHRAPVDDGGDKRAGTYLCITISNVRKGGFIRDPEECFVPFKNMGSESKDNGSSTGAWTKIDASPDYIRRMRTVWLEAMRQSANAQPEAIPPLHRDSRSGAVKATTGLGLPLCRGFAQRSGGWLALDQSQGDGMTHLWCVIEASALTLSKSRRLSMKLSAHTQRSLEEVPAKAHALAAVQPLKRAFGSNNSVRELMEKGKGGGRNESYHEANASVRRLSLGYVGGATQPCNYDVPAPLQQRAALSAGPTTAATAAATPTTVTAVPPAGAHVAIVHIGDIQSKRCLSMESTTMSADALPSSCTACRDSHASVATSASMVGDCVENAHLGGATTSVTVTHSLARTGKSFRSSKYKAGVTRQQIDYKDLRVAIVDDEAANQRVGIRFLKMLGVKVEHISVFSDGAAALDCLCGNALNNEHNSHVSHPDLLTAAAVQSCPHVMLLDIRMPGMSGVDVLREYGKAPPFPVVAMTGNVDVDSVAMYRSVGFTGCIGKPFNKRGLARVIDAAINNEWTAVVEE